MRITYTEKKMRVERYGEDTDNLWKFCDRRESLRLLKLRFR